MTSFGTDLVLLGYYLLSVTLICHFKKLLQQQQSRAGIPEFKFDPGIPNLSVLKKLTATSNKRLHSLQYREVNFYSIIDQQYI